MKLMIVESPGKIKKIQSILGDGWQVRASVGHVRDLPVRALGVDLEQEFKPQYEPTERGASVISQLKSAASKATEIWLATDLDREGESIAWHLKEALGLKQYKRVAFAAIAKPEILQALQSPRLINTALVLAQEGRRVMDRLVGYLVSPRISDTLDRDGLSAGRVQTPALGLVVERELAISDFVSITYFDVLLHFQHGDLVWSAQWDPKPFFQPEQTHWTDQALAQRVAGINPVTVKLVDSSEASQMPPAPFITSTLQQAGSVMLKLPPAKTMQLAQKLYESGYITYMRTDAPSFSDDAIREIQNWLNNHGFGEDIASPPNRWKAKESAQEAHEAIRPTDFDVRTLALADPDIGLLQSLYDLIWLRSVACQLRAAKFDVQTVQLDGGQLDGKPVRFVARGRVLRYPGWKKLLLSDDNEEGGGNEASNAGETEAVNGKNVRLPALSLGTVLPVLKGECKPAKTKPPARYTEASLIKALETLGIGRPSTFAATIATLYKRQYMRVEKQKLYAEPLGTDVFKLTEKYFAFSQTDYTELIESRLDLIAQRKDTYLSVISDIYRQLETELASMPEVNRRQRGGKGEKTVGRNTSAKRSAHETSASQKKAKSSTGPDNNQSSKALQGDHCPDCKKGTLKLKTIENGKNAGKSFIGCSNFPTCRHFAWSNAALAT